METSCCSSPTFVAVHLLRSSLFGHAVLLSQTSIPMSFCIDCRMHASLCDHSSDEEVPNRIVQFGAIIVLVPLS